ncbi:cytochrome P450 4C1-like [Diachasmimorpha longicaudata]|uniref:cytochrome P450 4C1-like n=1 Tax=Diachasmimorpha longicaudata TaxID=58733 RepID=UPI0030B89A6C
MNFTPKVSNLSTISPAFAFLIGVLTILLSLRWWNPVRNYLRQRSIFIEFAKTLPGPRTLPFFGNALTLWETDKTVLTLTKIGREINASTFKFWLGPALKIVVTDPHDLEIIMMSSKATKKDDVYQLMQPAVVNGLINSEGAIYRAHKKLLTPIINSNTVVNRYAEIFNYQSSIAVKRLQEKVGKGEFDMHEDIGFCVGDVAFETLTGMPGTCQMGQPSPFLKLTQEGLHIVCYRMMRPWLYPDFIFYLTNSGRKLAKIVDDAHAFIDHEIRKRQKEYKPIHSDERTHLAVVDYMVDHMMRNNDITVEEIRYEIVTLFVGLFETVEGLCCMILLMIAMHPEVQDKVRAEINNAIKNDYITDDETTKLEYLDMVIKESIRLFPVGPILPRKITEEMKLSTCTVPKGSSLFMLPYATHRDPKYWKNPEEFIPERFTPENAKNRHPFAYVPYSAGPRICPGPKYGVVCVKIVIAHIVRNFRMSTSMKLNTMPIHTHISTRSVDGYRVTLDKIDV